MRRPPDQRHVVPHSLMRQCVQDLTKIQLDPLCLRASVFPRTPVSPPKLQARTAPVPVARGTAAPRRTPMQPHPHSHRRPQRPPRPIPPTTNSDTAATDSSPYQYTSPTTTNASRPAPTGVRPRLSDHHIAGAASDRSSHPTRFTASSTSRPGCSRMYASALFRPSVSKNNSRSRNEIPGRSSHRSCGGMEVPVEYGACASRRLYPRLSLIR